MSELATRIQRLRSNHAEDWPADLADLRAGVSDPRNVVDNVRRSLHHGAALVGGAMRADVAFLVPVVEAAAAAIEAEVGDARSVSWTFINVASVANTLACVGQPISASTMGAIVGWLPRVKLDRKDSDRLPQYWAQGFAGLALDVDKVYYRIAGHELGSKIPFRPGATFELNLQGLLAHLAGAVQARAEVADVLPAFSSFLGAYPALLDARSVDPALLPWIARVIHHRIGGRDLGGSADFLHTSLWQAAGLA